MSEWTDDEISRIAKGLCCSNGCVGGHHGSCLSYQVEPAVRAALSAVCRVPDGLDAEIARLTDLCERLRMEAQTATVNEVYQFATGATGEPGNWRGSKPIKTAIDASWNEAIEAAARAAELVECITVDPLTFKHFASCTVKNAAAIRELKR